MTSASPRSKQKVNQIVEKPGKEESDSDDEYVYSTGNDQSKIPKVTVRINSVDVSMIVDTGASTDIIDEDAFGRSPNTQLSNLVPRLNTYLPMVQKIDCLLSDSLKVKLNANKKRGKKLLSMFYEGTMVHFSVTRLREFLICTSIKLRRAHSFTI